jgi:hypothetical protein
MLDFSKLETPAEDEDVLIEPPAERWPGLIARNRTILEAADYDLGGQSLCEARDRLRGAWSGDAGERPVLAGGHQPEFVHPGVWAKHVVLRHVGDQLNGAALDLVVDHYAPRNGALSVPHVSGEGWVEIRHLKLTDGAAGASYEGRPVVDEPTWRQRRDEIRALVGTWTKDTCVETYLAGLKQAETPRDFVDQHLAGRRAVDRRFEATVTELRVGDVYGPSFTADLLINAEPFAARYNEALAAYRREFRVKSASRPLPDLGRSADRIEAALWIYRPGAPRQRLWLSAAGERMTLYGDAQKAGEIDRHLLLKNPVEALDALAPWRIRPRALTLTLWARLLACDLFVHGIGGAKYDRITDRIIATYYGIEPPAYACVSATLRLPLPRCEGSQERVRAARHELRDVHYNPQRYLESAPADLLERRRALIDESDALRREGGAPLKRREVFRAIREVNGRLMASEAGLEDGLVRRLGALERGRANNEAASSREYFYALQPRERLERLAKRLRDASRVGC